MNAKFKELMEIASSGACYDNPTNTLIGTEIELFARYIVQECADVIHKRIGAKSAADILDHFGIE